MAVYNLDDIRDFIALKDDHLSTIRRLVNDLGIQSIKDQLDRYIQGIENGEKGSSFKRKSDLNILKRSIHHFLPDVLMRVNEDHCQTKQRVDVLSALVVFLAFFEGEAKTFITLKIMDFYLSQSHQARKVSGRLEDTDFYRLVFESHQRYQFLHQMITSHISDAVLLWRVSQGAIPDFGCIDMRQIDIETPSELRIDLEGAKKIRRRVMRIFQRQGITQRVINAKLDMVLDRTNLDDQAKQQFFGLLDIAAAQINDFHDKLINMHEAIEVFAQRQIDVHIDHVIDDNATIRTEFYGEDTVKHRRNRNVILEQSNQMMEVFAPKYVIRKLPFCRGFFSHMNVAQRFKYLDIIETRRRIKQGLCTYSYQLKVLTVISVLLTLICFVTPMVMDIIKSNLNLAVFTNMAYVLGIASIAFVFVLRLMNDKKNRRLRDVNQSIDRLFNDVVRSNALHSHPAGPMPSVEHQNLNDFIGLARN